MALKKREHSKGLPPSYNISFLTVISVAHLTLAVNQSCVVSVILVAFIYFTEYELFLFL